MMHGCATMTFSKALLKPIAPVWHLFPSFHFTVRHSDLYRVQLHTCQVLYASLAAKVLNQNPLQLT